MTTKTTTTTTPSPHTYDPYTPPQPKLPTYKQARATLFAQLKLDGWKVTTFSPRTMKSLQVPYATSPNTCCKLWFKTEAVYMSDDGNTLANARSLHRDIRKIAANEKLLAIAGRMFDRDYESLIY